MLLTDDTSMRLYVADYAEKQPHWKTTTLVLALVEDGLYAADPDQLGSNEFAWYKHRLPAPPTPATARQYFSDLGTLRRTTEKRLSKRYGEVAVHGMLAQLQTLLKGDVRVTS